MGLSVILAAYASVRLGVRLALGAMRSQIVARFMMQGLRVAAVGCLAGLSLAIAMTRFLAGMLYGVSPLDPPTYAGVICLILAAVALRRLFLLFAPQEYSPSRCCAKNSCVEGSFGG